MAWDTLYALVRDYGILAVLIGTFFEGETILIIGGFFAQRGLLPLEQVMAAAFFGSLCGDQLAYFIGWKFGRPFLDKRPKWRKHIAKVECMIQRHRNLVILTFRFFYGLRNPTPFLLGALHVPFRIFIPLNAIGALIWAIGVAYLGYFFGQAAQAMMGKLHQAELWIMGVVAVLGGGLWLFLRWRKKRHEAALGDACPTTFPPPEPDAEAVAVVEQIASSEPTTTTPPSGAKEDGGGSS